MSHNLLETFKSNYSAEYEFIQKIIASDIKNQFIISCSEQLNKNGTLSDRQVEAIQKNMSRFSQFTEQKIDKDAEPIGAYVGQLRERYDMTLKYVGVNSTKRGFYVHNFVDRNGSSLMCFGEHETIRIAFDPESESRAVSFHVVEPGDCFTCRATVNRHTINEFYIDPLNKVKQTVLNRIKYNKFLGQ